MNGRNVSKFQNDLKDERRRAQMAAARQVLERSTMMLLTSSKTCLRHPECPSARENRDTVFCQMRRAMDLIHYVVKDGVLDCSESQSYSNSQVNESANRRNNFRQISPTTKLASISNLYLRYKSNGNHRSIYTLIQLDFFQHLIYT